MHPTDTDRNEYNDIRPVFIGQCPECGAKLDEDDDKWDCLEHDECEFWQCPECECQLTPDMAYTI